MPSSIDYEWQIRPTIHPLSWHIYWQKRQTRTSLSWQSSLNSGSSDAKRRKRAEETTIPHAGPKRVPKTGRRNPLVRVSSAAPCTSQPTNMISTPGMAPTPAQTVGSDSKSIKPNAQRIITGTTIKMRPIRAPREYFFQIPVLSRPVVQNDRCSRIPNQPHTKTKKGKKLNSKNMVVIIGELEFIGFLNAATEKFSVARFTTITGAAQNDDKIGHHGAATAKCNDPAAARKHPRRSPRDGRLEVRRWDVDMFECKRCDCRAKDSVSHFTTARTPVRWTDSSQGAASVF